MNSSNQLTYRYGKYNWTAVDAFRGTFPYARTDWDRPNTNQSLSWSSTITNTLVNELSYTYGLDEVFINVFPSELYKRSTYGINYPYIFPDFKEIPDKIPTITIGGLTEIDGGPYPSSSRGPIHTFSDTATWVKSRHTFKGGIVFEYSARTTSTRSTSSRFPAAPTIRTADSSSPTAEPAEPAWPWATRRWACSRATRRLASAR